MEKWKKKKVQKKKEKAHVGKEEKKGRENSEGSMVTLNGSGAGGPQRYPAVKPSAR